MTKFSKLATISALSLTLLTSASFAQDDHHDNRPDNRQDNHGQDHRDRDNHQQDHRDDHQQNDHYVQHNEWKRGRRMNNADWSRGQRVDYQQYHLAAPRRGYEWRQVDGNYVLAAAATGLISSIVIASSHR